MPSDLTAESKSAPLAASAIGGKLVRHLDDAGRAPKGAPAMGKEAGLRIWDHVERVARIDARLESEAAHRAPPGGPDVVVARAPVSGPAALLIATLAEVLEPSDWLFGSSRFWTAAPARGMPWPLALAHAWLGVGDPQKGHAHPGDLASKETHVSTVGSARAQHITHAAGVAWGMRIRHDRGVVLAAFDGELVDAGDFHNALNFSGVFGLPIVFVVATSGSGDPLGSVEDRGEAYGVGAHACDGADPLAIIDVVGSAVDRARAGKGPALVEASLADGGGARSRFRKYLERSKLATADALDSRAERSSAELDGWLDEIERTRSAPPVDALFEDVYGSPPSVLLEQRAALRRAKGS